MTSLKFVSEMGDEHIHLYLDTTKYLFGLVVKASASRAKDPGFDSRLRRGDFYRDESYQ